MLLFIPVRLASTRLPQKAIADVNGLPMMIQVGLRAKESNAGEVYFACGDQELCDLASKHGFKSVLTDPALPTGTDRVHAACSQLGLKNELVINIQGDMPYIKPSTIHATAELLKHTEAEMSTAAALVTNAEDVKEPSVAKVALSYQNRALYFSRTAVLPYGPGDYYYHLGIYGFKYDALQKFVSLPRSPLEIRENLEQLRALENNMRIDVAIVDDIPLSVDTADDLAKARKVKYEQ